MLEKLKQFVPSKVCISCEGCCRFNQDKSIWRPKLLPEEKESMKESMDEGARVKTVFFQSRHVCQFLAPENNQCIIYDTHPFECLLYPFLLVRQGEDLTVAVHLACPFIQEKHGTQEYKDFTAYLKEFFAQPSVGAMIQQGAFPADDYSAYQNEIEVLFPLEPM